MLSAKHFILIILSLAELFLFGGIQFGWFALVFILKQEGVFKSLCVIEQYDNSTSIAEDCFPQDEQFNLIFSIGIAVFTVVSAINGQLYQAFDVKRIRIIFIAIGVCGILLFAFTSKEMPWLTLPGLIIVGVAGQSLLISNYIQIPVLLHKGSSIYLGLLNGCYDSSVLTFMLVKKLYEDGVDKKFTFIGFAVLVIVISGLCTLLHPSRDRAKPNSNDSKTDANISSKENNNAVVHNTTGVTTELETMGGVLRHPLFMGFVLWLTAVLLKYLYFLGSANRMMEDILIDKVRVSYFSDVMTFTMIGSVFSSSIAGYTIQAMEKPFSGNRKMVIPLVVTSCLAVLLSALAFVRTTTVLYVEFVVLTFLRSFIYTVTIEFIRIVFPLKFMSIIFGLVISFSGILTLCQYGLFAWTEKYDTAMSHVNGFLMCASTISLLYPILVAFSQGRKKRYNLS
ncbi:equilibrative nucleobase transporter 1-like [Argopecten irradians]|uniref:equilibrative nucleobase transporter 1-like n=1 Tax=Argopecten irradians TaxID=31199 RepID=UPI0037212E56